MPGRWPGVRPSLPLYLAGLCRKVCECCPLRERNHSMKVITARAGAAFVAGTVAIGVAVVPAVPATASSPAVTYSFRKLDNPKDPTFNQLLGINNHNKIVGYFGSGAQGSPNKGYLLDR